MTEELPKGWTTARIGDVCEINPRHFDQPAGDKDLVSFVPMASVEAETGRLDPSFTRFYSEVRKKSLTRFQEGDVLFSKITPCMENGKIALAKNLSGGRAVGSTEFMVLRCSRVLDPSFLMYFLIRASFRKEAEMNMAGAVGQRRVPKSFVSGSVIPVPPLAEQRRIVASLEAYLSRLDSASGAMKKSLLDIDSFRLSSIKRAYKGKMQKIGDLFSVAVGSTPSRSDASNWKGEVPWVSSGEVAFNRIKSTKELISKSAVGKYEKRVHPPGTVLIAMIGEGKTRGQVAVLDIAAAHNQNCASIRVSETEHDPDYVYFFLKGRYGETRRSSSGGNQLALNKSKVQEIEIPMISPAGQRKVVDKIEAAEAVADRMQGQVETALRRAENLRQALLATAFTGKLVPQDPSDEPAAVLIERIQSEHASVPKAKRARRSTKTPMRLASATDVRIPKDPHSVYTGEQTALEF
ncbi:restriction endonuclease subunit S [Nocardiopsis sp. FR26]|uniref:restriction endonuclease subunit S n=1 Tax=Nocardiopsis sp. FR26 TaxID=2605987 RepID=UPI001358D975|nr:restriction endonuclease subunit S [Nocardiopsis sp. FR26]